MFKKIKLISGKTQRTRIWEVQCNNCSSIKTIKEASLLRGSDCGCKHIGKTINDFTIINYTNKYYICRCKCGKIIKSKNILLGKQISCGCIEYGTYGKLTYNKNGIFCSCGKEVNIDKRKLLCGNTQSCGCYQKEKAKENLKKAVDKIKIYSDLEAEQRIRWRNNYNDMDFDLYLDLSNRNCFYCGDKPGQKYSINGEDYYRNGIDRVNNNFDHVLFNVVPCCVICNKMKRKRNLIDFYKWINRFGEYNFTLGLENPNNIDYYIYSHYKDGGIDIKTFAYLIRQKCYYCGDISNYWNGFNYNGLDRINNNIGHFIDNVVPCCKHCNYAKRNMSAEDFRNHVNKIKCNIF